MPRAGSHRRRQFQLRSGEISKRVQTAERLSKRRRYWVILATKVAMVSVIDAAKSMARAWAACACDKWDAPLATTLVIVIPHTHVEIQRSQPFRQPECVRHRGCGQGDEPGELHISQRPAVCLAILKQQLQLGDRRTGPILQVKSVCLHVKTKPLASNAVLCAGETVVAGSEDEPRHRGLRFVCRWSCPEEIVEVATYPRVQSGQRSSFDCWSSQLRAS